MTLLDDLLDLCEALRSEDASKWKAAMQEEYDLLLANGIWELTNFTKDRKSIRCKWVFHTKNHALDEIIRYNTRLIDILKWPEWISMSRLFPWPSLISLDECEIYQMNVKMTFLNVILEVEIYMDQLEDFVQEGK